MIEDKTKESYASKAYEAVLAFAEDANETRGGYFLIYMNRDNLWTVSIPSIYKQKFISIDLSSAIEEAHKWLLKERKEDTKYKFKYSL